MAQVDGRLVFTALHRNLNKSHDLSLATSSLEGSQKSVCQNVCAQSLTITVTWSSEGTLLYFGIILTDWFASLGLEFGVSVSRCRLFNKAHMHHAEHKLVLEYAIEDCNDHAWEGVHFPPQQKLNCHTFRLSVFKGTRFATCHANCSSNCCLKRT